jgi:energy-converting hydrogenase Eha subunit B
MITILKIILIGIGATFLVDIWAFTLNIFKIKSLDYRYVGRWIANFPQGKFFHKNIMNTPPVKGEIILGWTAHYLIGITFAFLLIVFYGETWLAKPTIFPAIIIGIVTVVSPLFIMQPAFGFGIASSKLSNPNMRRFKSLLTHLVYGVGLYLSALMTLTL